MMKITKVLALIICLTLSAINAEDKFLSNLEFSPMNAEEFVRGYVNGIELFDDVMLNSTCIQSGEIIVQDAIKVWDILKDLKIDTHIISNVKNLIIAVEGIVAHIKTEKPECQAAADIAVVDIKRLAERVSRDGWIKEAGSHAWENTSEIEGLIKDGIASFTAENMLEAGTTFGKATKFVAFWDL